MSFSSFFTLCVTFSVAFSATILSPEYGGPFGLPFSYLNFGEIRDLTWSDNVGWPSFTIDTMNSIVVTIGTVPISACPPIHLVDPTEHIVKIEVWRDTYVRKLIFYTNYGASYACGSITTSSSMSTFDATLFHSPIWLVGIDGRSGDIVDKIRFQFEYPSMVGGGDPEYDSLDGLAFTYDGPCQYLLATNECNTKTVDLPNVAEVFRVISRHGRARNREKQVVSISDVIVSVNATEIIVSTGNVVRAGDDVLDLIVNADGVSPKDNPCITIRKSEFKNKKGGLEEKIEVSTDFGLVISVALSNIATVWMTVPNGVPTCGLLGNNNGDTQDDVQLRNGTVLFDTTSQGNIDLMGDSWMVPYKQQPLQCYLHPLESETTSKICKLFDYDLIKQRCNTFVDVNLKAMTGKDIESCFADKAIHYIDPTRIFDDCITEMCDCHKANPKDCVPEYALNEWTQVCANAGVVFTPISFNFIY